MRHIHLHMDKAFFNKMQKDKLRREIYLGTQINWTEYVKILFGFMKYIK